MQIDPTAIANMALANLGQPAIQSLDQKNPGAVACKQRYDEARLEALSGALWGFASSWSTPAAVAADPKPGWSYVHQYPTNALRVFEIYNPDPEAPPIPFEVTDAKTGGGKWVHSNEESPTLIYTVDKAVVTTFDWQFIVAMAWLLSSKIAMQLTKSRDMEKWAKGEWEAHRADAKSRTKNESAVDTDQLSSYHAARFP